MTKKTKIKAKKVSRVSRVSTEEKNDITPFLVDAEPIKSSSQTPDVLNELSLLPDDFQEITKEKDGLIDYDNLMKSINYFDNSVKKDIIEALKIFISKLIVAGMFSEAAHASEFAHWIKSISDKENNQNRYCDPEPTYTAPF